MKKKAVWMIALVLLFTLAACGAAEDPQRNESGTEETGVSSSQASREESGRHVKMTIGSQEIQILLYDTPAADSLYEMLPLELEFSDYNQTEKIAYPPDELDTEGENFGVEPSVGDVCLYEPWGNVCIFYEDFSYSEDLVYLGKVESGMEALAAQNGDFAARIEPDEEQE